MKVERRELESRRMHTRIVVHSGIGADPFVDPIEDGDLVRIKSAASPEHLQEVRDEVQRLKQAALDAGAAQVFVNPTRVLRENYSAKELAEDVAEMKEREAIARYMERFPPRGIDVEKVKAEIEALLKERGL